MYDETGLVYAIIVERNINHFHLLFWGNERRLNHRDNHGLVISEFTSERLKNKSWESRFEMQNSSKNSGNVYKVVLRIFLHFVK